MAQASDSAKLKDAFMAQGGVWSDAWETILANDPTYFSAYLKLRSVPMNKKALPLKVQELVLLAVDASCTTIYAPGIRAHTAAALAAGATKEEIMETLQLSSVLGIHATTVGVPALLQVLEEEGSTPAEAQVQTLDERQQRLKDDFIAKRGYWGPSWEGVIRLDPDFFEAYTAFSSVSFRSDHNYLSPRDKELIFCAIDCATTHLYVPGLKTHMRNALRHSATAAEVMEVLELASLMGIHTVLEGASVLAETQTTAK